MTGQYCLGWLTPNPQDIDLQLLWPMFCRGIEAIFDKLVKLILWQLSLTWNHVQVRLPYEVSGPHIQWNLDNSNCRGTTKKVCYKKFELWVMLSLNISHVATIASPFCSSVFHFLAKLLSEIFFSCEKKINEVKLVTQECKYIQPQKM